MKARFTCLSVVQRQEGPDVVYSAELYPVFKEDAEDLNKKIWKNAPQGKLEIAGVGNMPFEVGKEYILKITEVGKNVE